MASLDCGQLCHDKGSVTAHSQCSKGKGACCLGVVFNLNNVMSLFLGDLAPNRCGLHLYVLDNLYTAELNCIICS